MAAFVELLPFAVALALLAPAAASGCEPGATRPDVDAGVVYVDQDGACDPECGPYTIWIYAESNGIPGLQRADDRRDDTCGGAIEADTVVF